MALSKSGYAQTNFTQMFQYTFNLWFANIDQLLFTLFVEMIRLLLLSQAEVLAEQEELVSIRNELQKRIETEREEIERLKAEVAEAQHKHHSRTSSVDSFEESLMSADSSSSESVSFYRIGSSWWCIVYTAWGIIDLLKSSLSDKLRGLQKLLFDKHGMHCVSL